MTKKLKFLLAILLVTASISTRIFAESDSVSPMDSFFPNLNVETSKQTFRDDSEFEVRISGLDADISNMNDLINQEIYKYGGSLNIYGESYDDTLVLESITLPQIKMTLAGSDKVYDVVWNIQSSNSQIIYHYLQSDDVSKIVSRDQINSDFGSTSSSRMYLHSHLISPHMRMVKTLTTGALITLNLSNKQIWS